MAFKAKHTQLFDINTIYYWKYKAWMGQKYVLRTT